MATLPVEVVEYIFEYLISLEDRKAASLVCQQWYRAYLHNAFRHMEVVNITGDRQLLAFPQLENIHRKYFHFIFKNVEVTESSLPFWERFGCNIRSLSFVSCYIREKMFVKALSYCTRLESLTIYECKDLFMSGLLLEDECDLKILRKAFTCLKTLNLCYNRYLSDAFILKILKMCPSLQDIVLTGCQISYHRGMFKKYYPNGIETPSESVTTFQLILRYIAANAKRIQSLALSETLIDNDALHSIGQIKKLNLESLQLRQCMQISGEGMARLCTNVNSLTELDLSHCVRITDMALLVIFSSLPKLVTLSLEGCRGVTDVGLASISQLVHLKNLNLAECEMVEGTGIMRGICYQINPKIKDLNASYMGGINEGVVLSIANHLPNLLHLKLASCFDAVTDVTIQAIFRHCIWLRSLDLGMCDRITDSGLTGMGVSSEEPPQIQIRIMRVPLGSKYEQEIMRESQITREVRQLSESEILNAEKSGYSLASLKGLQHLNLKGCSRISDVSLKFAFKLVELKTLNLSDLRQVSSEGVIEMVKNCPSIEDLNIDQCQHVDDAGVEAIVCHLSRLKRIVLGSSKVTNAISLHLQNHALQLSYIDLRHCAQITGEGVSHLFHSLPLLLTFHYPERNIDEGVVIPPPPRFRRS